jgi:hypothetical protein
LGNGWDFSRVLIDSLYRDYLKRAAFLQANNRDVQMLRCSTPTERSGRQSLSRNLLMEGVAL